jgi:hypothetical protein
MSALEAGIRMGYSVVTAKHPNEERGFSAGSCTPNFQLASYRESFLGERDEEIGVSVLEFGRWVAEGMRPPVRMDDKSGEHGGWLDFHYRGRICHNFQDQNSPGNVEKRRGWKSGRSWTNWMTK